MDWPLDPEMCNRCGRVTRNYVTLGQNGLAFDRHYCNDEWTPSCWAWVRDFQIALTGRWPIVD